jgi:hypothetical protein
VCGLLATHGWVSFNTDGASKNAVSAGCGGLIRDSIYGCLECGFSKIWGVVERLQLVWTCGLRL